MRDFSYLRADSIEAARNAYNLTDEGLDKMVARMKETGNYTDPDAAAAELVANLESRADEPMPPTAIQGVARYLRDQAEALERIAQTRSASS